MRKSIASAVAAVTASLFILTAAHAVTGTWIVPTSGGMNWNVAGNWQGGSIPNGQGDVAQKEADGTVSGHVRNDIVGGVTVGTLRLFGNSNHSMQFTPNENIILNQDGAGPGHATVINEVVGAAATSNISIFLNIPSTGNKFVLQDDLWLINNSNSTRSDGSIRVRGSLIGAGNIYMENVNNDINAGAIKWENSESGAGNGFAGDIFIRKGAVSHTRGDIFTPTHTKTVTIGAEGMGDASLGYVGTLELGNIENNFVVAANTGGTTRYVANLETANGIVQIKSTFTNFASVNLLGDITFENAQTNGSRLIVGDRVLGVGKITKTGPGPFELTNTNTYSGGTVVNNGSLLVRHAPEFFNGFGTHAATDGTLGTGDVTVNSAFGSKLEIESSLAAVNVIANTAILRLAGCDDALGCAGGEPDIPDGGFLQLGAGINEVVGALLLSSDGGVNYVAQAPGTYGASGSGATYILDEYFAGSGILTVPSTGTPGDYNGDNIVDAADYVVWRANVGTMNALPNDPDGGTIDETQYDTWVTNFGRMTQTGSGQGATAVPEPGTLLLVVAGVLLACAGRRRH